MILSRYKPTVNRCFVAHLYLRKRGYRNFMNSLFEDHEISMLASKLHGLPQHVDDPEGVSPTLLAGQNDAM